MEDQKRKASELVADLYLIEAHIRQLSDILEQCDHQSHVYEFPKLTQEDVGTTPKSIVLTSYAGKQAFQKAMLHIRDFKWLEDEPGLFGRRLAGTVVLQSAQGEDLCQRIQAINTLKDHFQQSILMLHKNVDKRFELFKEALPGVSKKAITRHILLAPSGLTAINFSWAHKYSGKTFTREEVADLITNSGKQVPAKVDAATWEIQIQTELEALRNANHTNVFYLRRPLRVTPTANLYTSYKSYSITSVAHSPIFVINQSPVISEFNNFPHRSRESKAKQLMLVIPRRHIYCEYP
ncbi:DNA replication terminus site-binding protein [Rheinheimera hassiensis]|uniref:DNA replication terminus site-binding protein n=1 Tax=Rheinheimera hassiensis TaxID=1193627 RepID=UPI001F065C29|nr:DNA replication terminus site-binding protein [Rheinheimera hassiensis]